MKATKYIVALMLVCQLVIIDINASDQQHTNEVYSPTVSNPEDYDGWVWVSGNESNGRKEQYENRQIQGAEVYLNGKLVSTEMYEDGQLISITQYSNETRRITKYKEGKRISWEKYDGDNLVMVQEYDKDQNVVSKYNYYTSGEVSRHLSYYPNGNRKKDMHYLEDGSLIQVDKYKEDIIVESIYYNGDDIIQKDFYSNGNRLTGEKYDKDGNVVSTLKYRESGSYIGTLESEQVLNEENVTQEIMYNYLEAVTSITDYTNGEIEKVTIYKDDIITRVDEYENNLIARSFTYNLDGNKTSETLYSNGIRISRETFDDKGATRVLSEYTSDGNNYSVQEYYDNSKLQKVITYHPNSSNKQKQITYNDETIISEYHYAANGKTIYRKLNASNGDTNSITEYYNNGKTKSKKVFANGVKKLDYQFTTSGAYTKTFFLPDQTIVRRDYYNVKGDKYKVKSYIKPKVLDGYKQLKVDKCNTGTTLKPNVVVDIGVDTKYATRTYLAYTNKYGQLERVDAALIIAQNENREPVVKGSNGKTSELRYCKKQSNIAATQSSEYDRGHVIADSLGGAANAYNLTPQAKELNRYGAQFEMEEMFRGAFNSNSVVTDFTMKIEYKNNVTNIPYKYNVSYKIDGEKHSDSYLNK